MTYYDLILEAEKDKIEVVEKTFKSSAKGLCKGTKIAIRTDLPTCEKTCILAEEMGHYYTSVGDILDQENTDNIKQERKARAWAIERLVPFESFDTAYKNGYHTVCDIAEFLNLDEQFVAESIDYYERKLGIEFPMNKYDD